jgi:hypothetical protein
MTSLEQALATILKSIEDTKETGDPQALSRLLRRKQIICAVLAAPEQSWTDPSQRERHIDARREAA